MASHPICCLQGYFPHSSWSDAISYWPCHSRRGNQMRATNFRHETAGMNWGHPRILTLSLHLLLTLAGNLVRKLFRVCLWTMQSQVRLIQKEAQHKRRSYACSDDCRYSLAVVVEYFALSPFHLQKTQTRHTYKSVLQHRSEWPALHNTQ